jgi:gliding motility-associated lipoprotein GldD
MRLLAAAVTVLFLGISCAEYTPKPRGFYRIDLPEASYRIFSADDVPYTFHVSRLATVELPPLQTSVDRMNLSYESLHLKVYCSYIEITPETLPVVTEECRKILLRSAGNADAITEQSYEDRNLRLFATIFRIGGETPSPVQFMLTDSLRRFFRGALYYPCRIDTDSLAPVTAYVENDVIELIQSFRWK